MAPELKAEIEVAAAAERRSLESLVQTHRPGLRPHGAAPAGINHPR